MPIVGATSFSADPVSIPVRNIYYLLLYAWGHFKSGGVRSVGIDDSPDLPDLFAKVLNDGTHRLLRRGLDRGYVEITEETRAPRGKLRLDEIAKRQTMLRGYAVCDLDELTPDILHNQILKATLVGLSNCGDVRKDLRHELRSTARRLSGVTTARLTGDLFHRVQLSRNNAQYDLLMRVCELTFHSLLPDEQGTSSKFKSILDDETRMPALFEDFLRNFYRSEMPGYSVRSEDMRWQAEADVEADLTYLPKMTTDITIRNSDQTIIADAKYYRDALAGGRRSPKLHSGHLYQLATYLAHAASREPDQELSGILIYPSNGQRLRLNYRLLGKMVRIATVDLGSEWRYIHDELIEILQPHENSPYSE